MRRPHLILAVFALAWATPASAATAIAPALAAPWWAAPVLTGLVGVASAYVAIWFDRRKTSNQELIKKRIAIYDEVAPRLNDLYCFLLAIGAFRTMAAPDMVAHKRALDRTMFTYAPLFSPATFDRYQDFIRACFSTYTGAGHDATLRVGAEAIRVQYGPGWDPAWDASFAASGFATDGEVRAAYDALMAELASQIGMRRRR